MHGSRQIQSFLRAVSTSRVGEQMRTRRGTSISWRSVYCCAKKWAPGRAKLRSARWVFPEVWIFGNIRKALYFMHFGKRYESLSPARFPNRINADIFWWQIWWQIRRAVATSRFSPRILSTAWTRANHALQVQSLSLEAHRRGETAPGTASKKYVRWSLRAP